ncbi:MAG: hypothetical protein E7614_01430 [Ruminococcaceae bacterium]|nr:hypothetical protein [Oscillospiraceae bacterium]
MKLATRDKNLLVFLLVAVIIICAYYLGYKKFTAEKVTLESDIATLEKKIDTKKEQYKKKDFYLIMTNIYGNKFEEELEKFPEDIQEENQIMFFKEIEAFLKSEKNDFNIPSVSFTEGRTIIKFKETQKATGELYEGLSSTVSFPYTLEYEKFKELLNYLEEYEDRNVISTVSASYSEDLKMVSGSVVFVQYAISEETRVLLQPEIEDILLGTDNIFTSPEKLDRPDEDKELTIDLIAKRIESSFDMFVLLEPAISEFPTTTMGFLKSDALLRENKNDEQLVSIIVNEYPVYDLNKPIYDENGLHKIDEETGKLLYEELVKPVIDEKTGLQATDEDGELLWENVYEYKVTYTIGEGDKAKKIEDVLIQPTEYLDLYVYCSDRTYAEENEKGIVDKASVKATVINNTTKYDFINIYVVENNLMTEEEKEALAKEEALRESEGKEKREDLTIPRWTIDTEKSTMDKINVITTTDVANYIANGEEVSEESSMVSEVVSEESVDAAA